MLLLVDHYTAYKQQHIFVIVESGTLMIYDCECDLILRVTIQNVRFAVDAQSLRIMTDCRAISLCHKSPQRLLDLITMKYKPFYWCEFEKSAANLEFGTNTITLLKNQQAQRVFKAQDIYSCCLGGLSLQFRYKGEEIVLDFKEYWHAEQVMKIFRFILLLYRNFTAEIGATASGQMNRAILPSENAPLAAYQLDLGLRSASGFLKSSQNDAFLISAGSAASISFLEKYYNESELQTTAVGENRKPINGQFGVTYKWLSAELEAATIQKGKAAAVFLFQTFKFYLLSNEEVEATFRYKNGLFVSLKQCLVTESLAFKSIRIVKEKRKSCLFVCEPDRRILCGQKHLVYNIGICADTIKDAEQIINVQALFEQLAAYSQACFPIVLAYDQAVRFLQQTAFLKMTFKATLWLRFSALEDQVSFEVMIGNEKFYYAFSALYTLRVHGKTVDFMIIPFEHALTAKKSWFDRMKAALEVVLAASLRFAAV